MKTVILRNCYRVHFTELDVMNFNSSWPGSRIKEEEGFFEFHKANGDLQDASGNVVGDGPEYLAFSQDCQEWARKELGEYPT